MSWVVKHPHMVYLVGLTFGIIGLILQAFIVVYTFGITGCVDTNTISSLCQIDMSDMLGVEPVSVLFIASGIILLARAYTVREIQANS